MTQIFFKQKLKDENKDITMINEESLILAIDLGGTSAKCAFANMKGEMLYKFAIPTKYGDEVIPNLKQGTIDECLKTGFKYENIKIISFGCKGPFDKDKGVILNAGDIGFFNYPAKEVAEKEFKIPVLITNDSRAATIGEWKRGIGRNYSSFVCLTLGKGIGSGIVLDNKLWRGAHNTAGEIGHGGFMQEYIPCGCGLPFCLESLSGAAGIEWCLNYYADMMPASNLGMLKSKLNNQPLTIKDCSDLFKKKDYEAENVLKKAFKPLAARISLIAFLFDIEAILIGGGPSQLGDVILQPLKEYIKQCTWESIYKKLDIKICTLKNDAGIIGLIENVFLHHPEYKKDK